jgi:hypothetical protein
MSKRSLLIGFAVFAIFGMLMSAIPRESQAIPPFARKYATSCPTCHVVFPKLNAFGRAFRAHGYRIPQGEEMFIKDFPAGGQGMPLGASAWKKMFPDAIWPSDIAGTVPVGFFVDQRIRFKTKERGAGSKAPRTIFEGIHELEALVGGTFGERFSFFGDPKVWEGVTDSTEIGRLFIQYNRSQQFNLRFGILEPRAIGPFSKHRQWIRMEEHLFNKTPTISPGGNDLAKFSFRKSEGFEFYGAKEFGRHGIEYAAGILSGKDWQSSSSANGRTDSSAGDSSWREIDSDKDWYVSLAWKIGGMGVLGGEVEDEELIQTENWRDDSIKIGVFYYNGRTDVPATFGALGNAAPKIGSNHFVRTGFTLDLFYGDANIMAGAQFMRNRARDFEAPFDHKDFDAMLYEVELDYVVYPWLLPAIRYVLFDPSNYDGLISGDDNGFQQITANISLLGAANVKLMLEGTTKFDNDTVGRQEEFRVSFNWTL